MPPLHVVHCIPTLNFGGAERAIVDLVNATDPARIRFTLVLFFDIQPLAADIVPGHATVIVVKKTNFFGIGLRKKLRALFTKIQPDIVHTHTFSADTWGRLAARDLSIPLITTEHNVNVDEGWVRSFLQRKMAGYSDAYTACSVSVQDFARRCYGITKDIEVIPFGIPLARFENCAPVDSSLPLRLLILGRLAPQKGHEIAIKALAQLQEFSWVLHIVGDGPCKASLEVLVKRLGLPQRVVFSPATKEVPNVLGQHDIVLIPSRWEGQGIVAMEAMAAGRVVIASRVGGLATVVRDGENGFVAEPNALDFVRVLRLVLSKPDRCQHMGVQARAYAERHFDIQREVKQYEALYQRVAKRFKK